MPDNVTNILGQNGFIMLPISLRIALVVSTVLIGHYALRMSNTALAVIGGIFREWILLVIVPDDNPTNLHDFIVGRTPKWEVFSPDEIRSIRKSMGLPIDE